jgi:hypothetical protein
MIILLVFHGGPESDFSYSDWKTIVVDGKRRTPQGSFYISDGDQFFSLALQNNAVRSVWYRIKDFDEVSVRLVGDTSIAALKYRGEVIYRTEEYEAAAVRTNSILEDKMLMVTLAFISLIAFFTFKGRR